MALSQKPGAPSRGLGHEIYNFGRAFLVIITLYLVCLMYAWE